jgi:BirA family biotin operon repressor/biotin-[acetyl-CoA-carboxylase] ligase
VLRFDRVSSTNTLLHSYVAAPANDGLVLVADEQTGGRGKPGRTWHAPSGTSLLVSVLVFPPPLLRRPVLLTVLAAVAVCETVQEYTQRRATIKWPNDVLLAGRKVCGILIEQTPTAAIIGIGLNVTTSPESFVAAGLPFAGSLMSCTHTALDREAVLTTLLARLDARYADWLSGETNELVAKWQWHSGLLGQVVQVTTGQGAWIGRLTALSFEHIGIIDADGRELHWQPEAVEHLTAMGQV